MASLLETIKNILTHPLLQKKLNKCSILFSFLHCYFFFTHLVCMYRNLFVPGYDRIHKIPVCTDKVRWRHRIEATEMLSLISSDEAVRCTAMWPMGVQTVYDRGCYMYRTIKIEWKFDIYLRENTWWKVLLPTVDSAMTKHKSIIIETWRIFIVLSAITGKTHWFIWCSWSNVRSTGYISIKSFHHF